MGSNGEGAQMKKWSRIGSFEEWLALWGFAATLEQGLGLLDQIFDPLHERERDPRVIRFLMETADWRRLETVHTQCVDYTGSPWSGRDCWDAGHQLQRKAYEMLAIFLRQYDPNYRPLREDAGLLVDLTRFMADARQRLALEAERYGKDPYRARLSPHNGNFIEAARYWLVNFMQQASPAAQRELLDTADRVEWLCRATLWYEKGLERLDSQPLLVEALTRIAFTPTADGQVPQTWEEAFRWPHDVNAAAALHLLRRTAKCDPASLPKLTGKPPPSDG